jgi:hypothetical protein
MNHLFVDLIYSILTSLANSKDTLMKKYVFISSPLRIDTHVKYRVTNLHFSMYRLGLEFLSL